MDENGIEVVRWAIRELYMLADADPVYTQGTVRGMRAVARELEEIAEGWDEQ